MTRTLGSVRGAAGNGGPYRDPGRRSIPGSTSVRACRSARCSVSCAARLADGRAQPPGSVSNCATPRSQPGYVAGWRLISSGMPTRSRCRARAYRSWSYSGGRRQPASVLGSPEVLREPARRGSRAFTAIGPLITSWSYPGADERRSRIGVGAAPDPQRRSAHRPCAHDDLETGTAVRPVRAGSVPRANLGRIPAIAPEPLAQSRSAACLELREREGRAQTGGALTVRARRWRLRSCRA